MPKLLIVEDGTEYRDFFELFLQGEHTCQQVQSGARALELLDEGGFDLVVLDMRFERSPAEDLLGKVDEVAASYFGGDLVRAHRYLEENQGTLILGRLREAGHDLPVLFVSDMPGRKVENLRRLYGRVRVVPNFDAQAIRQQIAEALAEGR